jgi:hypothetical protein
MNYSNKCHVYTPGTTFTYRCYRFIKGEIRLKDSDRLDIVERIKL